MKHVAYKVLKKQILFILTFFMVLQGYAQVSINTTGNAPDSSAILDVSSTAKGVLIPRMNSYRMNHLQNPAIGLMIFNTDDSAFYFFNVYQWEKIGRAAKAWDKNGNYIYTNDSVGIGVANPVAPLEVKGRISQTGTGKSVFVGEKAGTNNDTTTGLYNVGIGYDAFNKNVSGKNNIAIGGYALQNNTIGNYNTGIGYILPLSINSESYYNTAVGYNALFFDINDAGIHNTALGTSSLALNSTGKYNTAAGYYALYKNTNDYNTAFGAYALKLNTSGNHNVAFGYNSLLNNTTGSTNVAAGSKTMENNDDGDANSAVGDWSLKNNTSGYGNVAVGNETLNRLESGNINTALGNKAGHENTNGSRNVFIGNMAGYHETGSNKLYIDNSDTLNPLIGGDFQNSEIYLNGKTGIGTQYPHEELEVAGTDLTGSHSGRMIVSDGGGAQRRVLLFVSPNHDDTDTNARIEAFNYGSWTGQDLDINNVGHGKTLFYGDVDINATVKIGTGSSSPESGMLQWDNTSVDFEGFNGSSWVSLTKTAPHWGNIPMNAENASITANDGAAGDFFGWSVDASGNYAIVGAPDKEISENQNQGCAYIFYNDSISWTQQAILLAPDGSSNDGFGASVSIDGGYAVIGAEKKNIEGNHYQGKAYVFYRNGNNWYEQNELTASDGTDYDFFGSSVSIDGNYIIIGAPFKNVGGNHSQGEAYIFSNNGSTWTEQSVLTASDGSSDDEFGNSVSVSGDYAVVEGGQKVYVFNRNGSSWDQQVVINPGMNAHTVSINGDYFIVGGDDTAYVYHRSSSSWNQQTRLSDVKGCSDVSVSGDYALVGMAGQNIGGNERQGKASVYHRSGPVWSKSADITSSDGEAGDNFGGSVSIDGDYIFSGAYGKDVNNDENRGKVYIFQHK